MLLPTFFFRIPCFAQLGRGAVLLLFGACSECPDDEVIGEAHFTAATQRIVAFTEEEVLTYSNASGEQLRLQKYKGDTKSDDELIYTPIANTCDESWLDKSHIVLYTEYQNVLYQSDQINISVRASIRNIEQPDPYDTVFVDVLSVSINERITGERGPQAILPISSRNHAIDPLTLDSSIHATSYRTLADTVLLGVSLTDAFYLPDEFGDGEIFITPSQGVAAFRVSEELWVRD